MPLSHKSAFPARNNFSLDAGTSSITFNEDLGAIRALGTFTINEADAGVIFGGADSATPSSTGPVTLINTDDVIDLGVGTNVIGGTGIVFNAGSGTLSVQTSEDNIRLNGAVTLHTDVRLDTDNTLPKTIIYNLNPADKGRLTSYLENVREIERRIQAIEKLPRRANMYIVSGVASSWRLSAWFSFQRPVVSATAAASGADPGAARGKPRRSRR
mgnify:CR=1 FL=1